MNPSNLFNADDFHENFKIILTDNLPNSMINRKKGKEIDTIQ